jgi:hypothetical protein
MTASASARAAAPARGRSQPVRRTPVPRPQLRAVPAPPWRAPLAPFVLVAVALVVSGLLGLLLLNTLVAQDSFRVRQLERETTALREQEQQLRGEVAHLDAPGVLAAEAARLGMVPAGPPAFLRLSDGRVFGHPSPAPARPQRPAPTATAPAPDEAAKTTPPATNGKTTKTPETTKTGEHRKPPKPGTTGDDR